MTVEEDTHRSKLNVSQLANFDREIQRFDVIMDVIQEHMPETLEIWDRISQVRDAVFKLQQQLRGIDIEVFAAPWLDPEEENSLLEDEEEDE
jgi:hypothetical protein